MKRLIFATTVAILLSGCSTMSEDTAGKLGNVVQLIPDLLRVLP